MKTRIFKSGNSMALRIPGKFAAKEGEVSIEQVGTRWIVEPVVSESWPKGFFGKIRITDPAFSRPEQGSHREFAE
jgi:virulence-associated protein VagC